MRSCTKSLRIQNASIALSRVFSTAGMRLPCSDLGKRNSRFTEQNAPGQGVCNKMQPKPVIYRPAFADINIGKCRWQAEPIRCASSTTKCLLVFAYLRSWSIRIFSRASSSLVCFYAAHKSLRSRTSSVCKFFWRPWNGWVDSIPLFPSDLAIVRHIRIHQTPTHPDKPAAKMGAFLGRYCTTLGFIAEALKG